MEHRLRNGQTDLFSRLQIGHKLKLHRLFHGQVSWFRASEDLIHVRGGASIQIINTHAIADKPPAFTYSRLLYITGSRLFTASSAISLR